MSEEEIARLICCGPGGCRDAARCSMGLVQPVKPTIAARDIVRAMAPTHHGGPIELLTTCGQTEED